jgi:hypothetical protein
MQLDPTKIFDITEQGLIKDPLVQYLLEIIQKQSEEIDELKSEIRLLKGQSDKPTIKPSLIEKPQKGEKKGAGEKRAGSAKREKTKELVIHKVETIEAEGVQNSWIFKGYNDYIVQDLIIQAENTKYRLKKYMTPEGKYITAKLPKELEGTHYGITLQKYILHQHYHCLVTQPLLLEQLEEIGIDISTGELSNILIKDKELFHQEKESLLAKALEISAYIQTDDTGARHNGKNGYCTVICNDLFTYFKSGQSKSRINFLELLRTVQYEDYQINQYAISYMEEQGLPTKYKILLENQQAITFENKKTFEEYLKVLGIDAAYAIRIITEGALIGSIMEHGINKDIAIISDDAGQFDILIHGLCWVHAERNIQKVHCFTEGQKQLLEDILNELWGLYSKLKSYKVENSQNKKKELEKEFDALFTKKTAFLSLDQALEKVNKNKTELLLVLERPEVPLHNNTSERDIREYVKKRKISGSTRSEDGKKCRDTFASLKKTCKKQKVSFWKYLEDRLMKKLKIPLLSEFLILNTS